MTLAEKQEAIENYCDKREHCEGCPLFRVKEWCYSDYVERNYEIIFGPDRESEDCDSCAFFDKEPLEEPCINCKNNTSPNDPQFESTPCNWKPKGHIEPDPIKPGYYNDTKITPFDVIDDWGLNFYLGNAVKYIKRAGKKAGNSRLQDLKKIREYIDHEIRAEELNK